MTRLRRSRRIIVLALAVLAVLGGSAIGYLQSIGFGTASASVGELGAPSDVTATATPGSGTVPITWSASPAVNGISPQGYYVVRHESGGGTAAACGTLPSIPTIETSCDDPGIPDGTYTYTVVAEYHSFTARSDSSAVTVVNDATPPSVTVDQKAGQADPANTLPIRFTVSFSEPVTGFDAGDLTRGGTSTGGTVAVTGSGASYEITLSGSPSNGSVTFSIAAARVQDLAGNSNTVSTSADNTVTYDTVPPTVTVNQKSGQADPANALPILWTVTFSEPVTGFTAADLTRGGTTSGGTIAVTGSGASYEIALSGTPAAGTTSFSIAAARAQDLAGNNNAASTSADNSVTYDATAPALTLTTPANGAALSDTTPALSGAAGNAAGDSSTVTVKIYSGTGTGGAALQTLTPTRSTTTWSTTAAALAQGTYTAQATQTDTAGNVATSAANTFVVDTTAPTVTVNQKPGQSDPTNALPILYTITFSEPVSGFVATDLTRTGTSTGGTISVTGSGAGYEAAVTGSVSSGTLTLSLNAGRTADAAGNANAASTGTDGTVTYDATAPAVTLTSPANGATTASTTPVLSGAAGNAAGDSTTVTVTVYAGTGTSGSVQQTLTPTRSAATWTATAATLAQGTYTAQATQTDALGNVGTSTANTFVVDTTAPALSTLQMLDTNADGKINQVKATFDETLAPSTATAPWTLTNVPSGGTLGSVSTSGTVATLTLTQGAATADTSVGAFKLALAASAGAISDVAGNQASFAATAPDDLAGPVLVTATSTAGTIVNRMQSGDAFALTFSEPLAPASVPGSVVVTEQRSGSASLTVPGLMSTASISTAYLASNNSSVASATSPSALSNLNKTVTVTLGTLAVTGSGAGTGSGGASIAPAATLTDPAGNAARATAGTMSPLF
jgi:hypothetical protein